MTAEVTGGWDTDGESLRERLVELYRTGWRDDTRRQWTVAFWVVVFVAFRFWMPVPFAILFLGAVLGSLSALVGMGLVLIYRANRIINFAQAQVGGLAASLAASLIVGPKWGFFPAVGVGLVAAVAMGAATEFFFIRRFAKAPRLLLTVATIGILQLFAFGQLVIPKLFDFDTVPQPPVPFDVTFTWGPVVFRGAHVLILIVVPIVALGLGAFFRYTRIGIAVRASAESRDRAALLGVPVKRVGTLVWMIAAGLSALGVLLRLPIQGVNIGAIEGSTVLLAALAAAVMGRMESMPKTFVAALGLGMVSQAVLFQTGRTVKVDGIFFAVIVLGLLLQRRGNVSRAEDIGASSWAETREVRPIPRELIRLPEIQVSYVVGALVAAWGLIYLPLHLSQGSVNRMGIGLMFGIVTMSLVVLTGWAGQISLGQVAFMAFGAAVGGSLAQHNANFFICVFAAGLVGALMAVLIGLPALRIRGLFLAVSTLAFALATGTFLLNNEFFAWLVPDPNIRIVRPELFGKFDLEKEHTYYFVILIFFLLTAASVRSLRRSRTGRILVAIRDNQRAAQSYAVNATRAKLTAFALSGFYAALAGGLYVFHQHGMSSRVLDPDSSIRVFSMAVIGGLGSIPGALLGAAYMTFVDYSSFTREIYVRLLATGVGTLVILMFIPGGLGSVMYGVRDSALRFIARRRNIVVPSLLADVRVEDEENILDEGAVGDEVEATHLSKPKDPILTVSGVNAGYGKTQVLFGVEMHVERGEMVALLGTNGAGKSTLLSVISGLLEPSDNNGQIIFNGTDITGCTPQEALAAGVVFMPGGKGVFPTLTVEENFRLAGWTHQKDQDYLKAMYDRCFGYFPVLKERWDQKAGNLSGGEQQMLTLSQALIARPHMLMIDELSLGLAPRIVEQLLGIVREIHAAGTTVILVEQSVNVAITLAQRAIFMEKGEVRFDGPTKDLLERPDILRAVFLQGAEAGRASSNGEGPKAVARKAFVPLCRSCGHEHKEALQVTEVGVSFGGVRAVNGVTLGIRQGEIVGIIGPNGSGKTTLFDLMSGFVPPTEGRVDLNGEDVTDWSPDRRAEIGLGRSFQDARLFPSMTVRQSIAVALERHLEVRDPLAGAVISPAVRLAERTVNAEVDALIDLMHLGAFADKFVGELSTGTRRVVDIACSMAHQPNVLLLDEPSSGIAQREAEALAPLILNIRESTGAALVVIEHDMPLIRAVSDRLVALELGEIIAEGDPDKVISDPRVVEGYLGGTLEVIERSGAIGAPPAKARATTRKAAARATARKSAARKIPAAKKTAAKKAPAKKIAARR